MASQLVLRVAVVTFVAAVLLCPAPGLAQTNKGTTGGAVSGAGPGNTSRARRAMGDPRGGASVLIVMGSVITEDGSPLPVGVVIERSCGGKAKKEAYVDQKGNFGFEFGKDATMFTDASEGLSGGAGDQWISSSAAARSGIGSGAVRPLSLMGCELRAQFPGYVSSAVTLGAGQPSGQIDVGTIVLSPISRVSGTSVSAVSLQAPKSARKAMEKAVKALERQRPEEGEKRLKEAITLFPRFASAWHELGSLYLKLDRADEARQSFAQALEADASFVSPYIGLSRVAGLEQKWQEVLELTDRAVGMNPIDFPEGFYFNAIANFKLGNFEQAERSARKTLRLDYTHRYPQAHLLLAEILGKKNDNVGEAVQLRSYLKVAPEASNAELVRQRLSEIDKPVDVLAGGKQP